MNRLRPLWIVMGVSALVIGAWNLSVRALETWQLWAITRRTEALKADFDARDYLRPVLRGIPEPGNAWGCYLPALMELDAEDRFSNEYVHVLSDYINDRPAADPSSVEKIFARHGSVLALLRQGTRRGDTRFPYDWSIDHIIPGVEFGDPRFPYDWKTDWDHWNPHLEHQAIYLLSRSKAKWLRMSGRPLEAAELLLDMCVFERDRAHNDFWNTSGHVGGIQDELHALLVSRALGPPELQQVARELAILVEAEPDPRHLYRNAILELGMEFREELRWGRQRREFHHSDRLVTAGLRELYSYRLQNARAFWMMDRWSERLAQASGREWHEASKDLREIHEEIERTGTHFDLLTGVPTLSASVQRKESTKLRLLLAGAHYLATGEFIEQPDPFGSGPLKMKAGDSVRFWSVGRDGMDNHGLGSWRGFWNEDLVLEVTR